MLADPVQITYDTVQETLPRLSFGERDKFPSVFETSDGEFRIEILETRTGDSIRVEVSLSRMELDSDGDPFTGSWSALPNRVGLVFEVNSLRYNSATDLPLIQAALLDLVDGPMRDRLIAGEK